MAAGKILVVDDLPDWQLTLSGLLMDAGYEVHTESSLAGAMELLKHERFHVAILDVRLDESNEDNRDGLQLMRQIKQGWPSVEVIILTGYADVKMAQDALNTDSSGNRYAYSFLEKDQSEELLKQVRQACEKSVDFLIAQGEQENIEFKSGIRWDYKENRVNKKIQLAIAKSIAGMLNYRGGTLLIGVADDGDILGIEKDLEGLPKANADGFRLALTGIIRDYLGLEFMKYIHARFEVFGAKKVCVVVIDPGDKPVFVTIDKKSEFWVRTGNSTRQLDVKAATDYIQSHWG